MARLAQTSKCHAQRVPAVDTHPDSEAPTPPGPGPPERAVRPRDALAALASGLPALADRTRSLRTWLPPGPFRPFFPVCPMLASPKVDLFTGSERYFAQGYEVNFVDIREWVNSSLVTIGSR